MLRFSLTTALTLLPVIGCGGDGAITAAPEPAVPEPAPRSAALKPASTTVSAPTPKRAGARGTRIVLRGSRVGTMLFDGRRQAIYVFERDRRNASRCYDECADAWPPVHTDGRPRAGRGVRRSLLGTIKRRGGRRQVTYAGRPLYYYAHEGPGQVLCHNVDLNGGLWWVVGPDGHPRP